MKIIINISEDYYKDIQSRDWKNTIWADEVTRAIHDGTVLPEHHGRLIDADAMKKHYPIMENDFGMVFNEHLHKELDNEPTIIEADIPIMYYPQVEGITPTVINNGSDMLSAEEIDNLLQALAEREKEDKK